MYYSLRICRYTATLSSQKLKPSEVLYHSLHNTTVQRSCKQKKHSKTSVLEALLNKIESFRR